MAGRDIRDEQDADDWFDEPDVSGAWAERSARLARARQPRDEAVEDWTSAAPGVPARNPLPFHRLLDRRVALVAALAVVCLLGILAAAGVFSSSHPRTALTTPAAATTATTSPPVTQAPPALRAPTTPLKPGDQGAAVRGLQRVLARLGYSPGRIDGQYGAGTTQAVSKFQTANGLTADGVVGPATRRALAQALAKS
jgi:putative peptidoglycan binding protein